jgi:osmoprotectant transport system permease protein
MGKTGIVWEALKSNAITCYPEYTGTISEELLKTKGEIPAGEMQRELEPFGIGMTGELGFDDTYALAMRKEQADRLKIRTISDLKRHPELRVALTHEFLERKDGWRPLAARYGLNMASVVGVEHTLGYDALLAGKADIKDAYSTDAMLASGSFAVLQDDLGYFPKYKAVFLYRLDAPMKAIVALRTLEGEVDATRMIRMNSEAEKTKDFAKAAALFFDPNFRKSTLTASELAGANSSILVTGGESFPHKLAGWTLRHLELVGISLFFAILVGIPLGIFAGRPGPLSQVILGITGMIQTIPSLALLALLVSVPFLGIQIQTAIIALFLYSLLPIVRNTATGLQDIPISMRESAIALGLEPVAQLRKVYLPMASRTILAGIKTSAIINVGTATLAALIGQGGLGEPIVSGLAINNNSLILEGAIPAAVLALLVQGAFDLLDRVLIPKGLRLSAHSG